VFAHSPEPGSGKSRLLEVLDLLVANSSGLLYQPTEAVLFRTANGKTQLLDEIDTWPNGDFLRGVLNAGFHRSGTVVRNERRQDNKWEPVAFPVYAPRAMAGIGSGILHGTTRDRTFILEMVKQTREERREKFRARKAKPEADQLKGEAEAWVRQNRTCIVTLYDDAEKAFPYLTHLRDRTIDITEPLAAILEVAYDGAPDLADRRLELLEAVALTRKDGEEESADHRRRAAGRECVGVGGQMRTRSASDRVRNLPDSPALSLRQPKYSAGWFSKIPLRIDADAACRSVRTLLLWPDSARSGQRETDRAVRR